jgi:hypothetical protein
MISTILLMYVAGSLFRYRQLHVLHPDHWHDPARRRSSGQGTKDWRCLGWCPDLELLWIRK